MNANNPRTIKELHEWYKLQGLPPEETTRFFIGKDYQQKRAFGIFKDKDGKVVVYKNKDDGNRTIRYLGYDEAYGVNELKLRLEREMENQRLHGWNGKDKANTELTSANGDTYKKAKYTETHPEKNGKSKKTVRIFLPILTGMVLIGVFVKPGINKTITTKPTPTIGPTATIMPTEVHRLFRKQRSDIINI